MEHYTGIWVKVKVKVKVSLFSRYKGICGSGGIADRLTLMLGTRYGEWSIPLPGQFNLGVLGGQQSRL
jgi:hypothetical protein